MSRRDWTVVEGRKALAMARAGMTRREIARALGRSEGSVVGFLHRAGWQCGRRYITPEDHTLLARFYHLGCSDVELAGMTGFHVHTVLLWRKRNGLAANRQAASQRAYDTARMRATLLGVAGAGGPGQARAYLAVAANPGLSTVELARVRGIKQPGMLRTLTALYRAGFIRCEKVRRRREGWLRNERIWFANESSTTTRSLTSEDPDHDQPATDRAGAPV